MTHPPIALTSRVAPPVREITVELICEELAPILSVPAEIVVLPVKVLLPFKVTVLVLSLPTEPPPEIALVITRAFVELKFKKVLFARPRTTAPDPGGFTLPFWISRVP